MGRYRAEIDNVRAHLRSLWAVIGLQVVVILALWFGWSEAPKQLTVHVPPDLRSGATLAVDQVPAALLGADVVVLPYRDGISFRRGSLHAALALGCPVLSTHPRVPLPELVDGENVRLVAVDDAEALSLAACELARDPASRARIGSGARSLARQFTWEHIAQRTVDEVFRPLSITQMDAGEP